MSLLTKIVDRLCYGLFLAGVGGGILMTITVFASTLLRYLFGSPVHFSNELAGLLFFSLTFLTIPHVLNSGRHIRIDLITRALSARAARLSETFAGLVLILFSTIVIYESWDFMVFSREIEARSDISGLLLWPWMALMPLSFVLCILVQLRHGLRHPEVGEQSDNEQSVEVA
ncbi:TRAP transporter small permease [Oceanimonas marisflavi]|uniref:TRAP transporter small permease n=1 Tax=Oceanimonas marisflavi TaxID=2059724 RepID=UPI000D2F6224|nr:TRAP transporter small permease [Oceanimonas marisflavi]